MKLCGVPVYLSMSFPQSATEDLYWRIGEILYMHPEVYWKLSRDLLIDGELLLKTQKSPPPLQLLYK